MTSTLGADTEVGRLRTVMLHRPGPELTRLTPRNNDSLLFDGIPWVSRAQDEHDAFALAHVIAASRRSTSSICSPRRLTNPTARAHSIGQVTSSLRLGDTRSAATSPAGSSRCQSPELAGAVTAGVRNEARGGHGLVTSLLDHDDFVIDPLPNLLFTRDSSVWLRDRVVVTSLAMPARSRETQLTELIYSYHPMFAEVTRVHGWQAEHLEGGDVLLLGPGVIAVGEVSGPLQRASSGWPGACSPTSPPTPSLPCPSHRSGRRCTSTPSARWSTPTPS